MAIVTDVFFKKVLRYELRKIKTNILGILLTGHSCIDPTPSCVR